MGRTSYHTALPPALLSLLDRFGTARDEKNKAVAARVLRDILTGLAALPPKTLPRAAREIFETARLYPPYAWKLYPLPAWKKRWPWRYIFSPKSNLSHAGMEYLYLFHRDGYLREAALDKIARPIDSPFFACAIAYCLNDWAEPVRAAACRCALRVFAKTDARILAEAALPLLERKQYWLRWNQEKAVFDHVFFRPDVAREIAAIFAEERGGPLGRVFTQALPYDTMDSFLPRLSREARHPLVRAIAARALIEGRVTWPEGFGWVWVDKSMGVRKWMPRWKSRDIARPVPIAHALARAASDRSAPVRKVAAEALYTYWDEVPDREALAQRLAGDKNHGVRERAAFVVRERLG